MIPILYDSHENTFNHHGIGTLTDCITCTCERELNGTDEAEFQYPVDGLHYSDIVPDAIVKIKADEYADAQLYRIYRITKPINGVIKCYCQHISYDLNTNICEAFSEKGINATTALQRVLEHCYSEHPFTASSTLSTSVVKDVEFKVPTPARLCLGGQEGSILDLFGGEYEFDNFSIKLYSRRGQDSGVTILYGKNLTNITSDTNLSSTYTAIYPYAVDDEEEGLYTLPEKVISTNQTDVYGEARILAVDLTDKFDLSEEDIEIPKLRQFANEYIQENSILDIDQNIEISFVQLWQSPEYKDIALLERVGMGDTVTVKHPKLGISVHARVIKTVYNVLTEKYEKIELGKAKSTLSDTFTAKIRQVEKQVIQNKSAMERAIDNATELITGQDGGYVVLNSTDDGHPYEILIMNEPDIQNATKLWRWNLGGLGYSKTGYNGRYETAITMDGAIVANFITTGTLNAGIIKAGILEDENHVNYWNMNTGEFKLSDGRTDAIKFSNGSLTINASFIKSGSINASLITTGDLSAERITTGILQDDNGTNYWNLDTGEFRLSANTKVGTASSSQTLSNYVNSAASSKLTQHNVYMALTNNEQLNGIYMLNNELYINASYLRSGIITSSNRRSSIDLGNGDIIIQLESGDTMKLNSLGMTLGTSSTVYTRLNYGGLSFVGSNGTMRLTRDSLSFEKGGTSLKIWGNSSNTALAVSPLETNSIKVYNTAEIHSLTIPYSQSNTTSIDVSSLSYKGKTISPVQMSIGGTNYMVLAYPAGSSPSVNYLNLSSTVFNNLPFAKIQYLINGVPYVIAAYKFTSTSATGTDITSCTLRGIEFVADQFYSAGGTDYVILRSGVAKSGKTNYGGLKDSEGNVYNSLMLYYDGEWINVFGYK